MRKNKIKNMAKNRHEPNKSSIRFKQNRLSISNLNSPELAFNNNGNSNLKKIKIFNFF